MAAKTAPPLASDTSCRPPSVWTATEAFATLWSDCAKRASVWTRRCVELLRKGNTTAGLIATTLALRAVRYCAPARPVVGCCGRGSGWQPPNVRRVVTVACDVRQCDEAAASRIESFSARVAAARAALQRSNARGGCEDGPADVGYAGSSTENDAAVHPEALAEGALVECSRWGCAELRRALCSERTLAPGRADGSRRSSRGEHRAAQNVPHGMPRNARSEAARRAYPRSCPSSAGSSSRGWS